MNPEISPDISLYLKHALHDLSARPYPDVPNPESNKKRASVALIIRIQARYSNWPRDSSSHEQRHIIERAEGSIQERIETFFNQDWVKHGDPEVLFIRRAARKGDRWTSHVALPGGKRDPEDETDQATAVRESLEEVGIDLSEQFAIPVGNLPQRVVTTSWGKVPLMVLCPYLFLLTSSTTPTLRLQPAEVASAHWVPLRALLSPRQRTYEYQDVSNRLAKQEMGIKRSFFRLMLGQMLFAAIHLIPSQSHFCSSIDEFIPQSGGDSEAKHPFSRLPSVLHRLWGRPETSSPSEKPLLLWGLTLGVMADFLELLPPHTALELWTYPTFTPWDMRLSLWIMSYSFRQRKKKELATDGLGTKALVGGNDDHNDVDVPPSPLETYAYPYKKPPEVGIGGLGAGFYYDKVRKCQVTRQGAISILLEGYYDIVQKAVATVLIGRLSIIILAAALLWKRLW